MIVQDVMNTEIVSLPDATPFLQAVQFFLQHNIHGAPIIDNTGILVGVISEKDLLRALYPTSKDFYSHPEEYFLHDGMQESMDEAKHKQVKHIMNTQLVTASPRMDIIKVGAIMVATGIHRMPVVDSRHTLIGMVSRHDIYKHIMKEQFHIMPATTHPLFSM
ncbi:MAG: hypothetical protein COV60_02310 [Candidatus Magasanikbacteria bacterium CG11_big_fil_rev_8_21_14_0_20_43_7]|uniref:CBS domain-containing protein n=1 Tax=Candidatus Magasanikbacteria bacterium CG11_big_fil_rev_8_21_14_0_20_43_7 TaxID=1974654 RepID=A0A2H0N2D0_9BACT|nr:MAG: hypothetical protein COV60_02310 [Candidatus Magasanikbacteria bacterium CG11_big_fil_rev_8_21_14_0_20_43_7]